MYPSNLGRSTSLLIAVGLAIVVGGCGMASSNNMAANPQMMPTTQPAAGGGTTPLAMGASLFTSQGCGACHTMKAAGATGKTGPTLDGVGTDPASAIRSQIADPNAEVIPGYKANVMPVFGKTLSAKQIDALVAYIKKNAS
ncbi:MAG: c-type cytochrome [Actinomycetes bacterium]